jgi:hypothetical protein
MHAGGHLRRHTKTVELYERPMIDLCRSSEFSTERLVELMKLEGIRIATADPGIV